MAEKGLVGQRDVRGPTRAKPTSSVGPCGRPGLRGLVGSYAAGVPLGLTT